MSTEAEHGDLFELQARRQEVRLELDRAHVALVEARAALHLELRRTRSSSARDVVEALNVADEALDRYDRKRAGLEVLQEHITTRLGLLERERQTRVAERVAAERGERELRARNAAAARGKA